MRTIPFASVAGVLNLDFVCRKKDQYQILFFPLLDPLTDEEKHRRKTVTSTTISHDATS